MIDEDLHRLQMDVFFLFSRLILDASNSKQRSEENFTEQKTISTEIERFSRRCAMDLICSIKNFSLSSVACDISAETESS
jgi:hypothetical protein